MAAVHAPREGILPSTASEDVCRVCGEYALNEDTPHEYATGLTNRLICQMCGAHRVLN